MASEQKMVTISTIPISKLSIIMNNFVANTITHLNKLSVKGDEKLAEFDKKLNDLDVMTTLLEAKLNSLPEQITSTYPPIQECGLDDIIPVIINNPPPKEEDNPEEKKDEGQSEQIKMVKSFQTKMTIKIKMGINKKMKSKNKNKKKLWKNLHHNKNWTNSWRNMTI